jgi:hypothetical protein
LAKRRAAEAACAGELEKVNQVLADAGYWKSLLFLGSALIDLRLIHTDTNNRK